jgi:hypothetical protein
MTRSSLFKTSIAALLIAGLAMGAAQAAATTAAPAAPIPGPTLGDTLTLDLGITQPTLQEGQELQTQMKKFGYDEDELDDWCLSKKQIRKGLIKANFDDVDFVTSLKDHRVRIEALYEGDGWVYTMQIDKCTGQVSMINPLYAAADLDY